jgi:hypothetical protein
MSACLKLSTPAAVSPAENVDGAAVINPNLLNYRKKGAHKAGFGFILAVAGREFCANRLPSSFKPCTLAHYLALTAELQGCQMVSTIRTDAFMHPFIAIIWRVCPSI